jgi:hypothetical protein
LAQDKPVLKQQISLDGVDNVVASSKQNIFLVNSSNNYTIINQSSKIQLGTIQLDIDKTSAPNWGKIIVWDNQSFIISTGRVLLLVHPITGIIDTLFSKCTFPEIIIDYTSLPWKEDVILIAAKTYPLQKDGSIRFSTPDAKNNLVYDDSKNCRLILFDTKQQKIIRSVKTNHAVTVFEETDEQQTNLLAGTFNGDVISVDSSLFTNKLYHAFDIPVHSVLSQGATIITVPHIAPKFLGDNGNGCLYIFNSVTGKNNKIVLPQENPVVDSKFGINPAPSGNIRKLFSIPKINSLLINYGYTRLLKLNLNTLDTVGLKVNQKAANFFCFNKDSSLLLAATGKKPGIFKLEGDIALYDIRQQHFQEAFNKPAAQEKFKSIYKWYDSAGNYHYIGLKSDYGIKDSLIIFSSNTQQITCITASNSKFEIDAKEQTLLLTFGGNSILGKLHLEKIWKQQYNFCIGNSYNKTDSLHKDIFTVLLDTRSFKPNTFPYSITQQTALLNNQYLTVGYTPSTGATSAYKILISDTSGNTLFKTADIDISAIVDICKVSASKKFFAITHQKANQQYLEVYNITSFNKVFSKIFTDKKKLSFFTFDKTKDVLWYNEESVGVKTEQFKLALNESSIQAKLAFAQADYLSFETDIENDLIASESYNQIRLSSLSNRKVLWQANPLTSYIKINYQPNGFSFTSENEFYSIGSSLKPIYFTAFAGYKPVELLNNYLYKADKSAINNLAFVYNQQGFYPSDFDIYFNRPDSVLLAAGSTNQNYLQLLQKVIEKRKRYYNSKSLSTLLSASPTIEIINKNQLNDIVTSSILPLQIQAQSKSGKPITAIHVLDNGVPVFGKKGWLINTPTLNASTSLSIPLVKDKNQLQLYAADADGHISASENLTIVSSATTQEKSKLHFIGIGINQFANSVYNLNWSVKDIRDLTLKLQSKYPEMFTDTLFNAQVTKENVMALKQRLSQLTENDKVIIAYSGHGVLNQSLDYYLSTYAIDFAEPQLKGLAYEDLENLLDDIKPRRKLLLIDACHSGEIDKEEIARIDASKKETDSNSVVNKSTIKVIGKTQTGMANSFELMQQLFVNLGKGTGATIISAAGGTQYAQERGDLKNGVFTYSLIEAFNKNNTLTVSELKNKVSTRVTELTNGLQKPTSRNENTTYNWVVW